MKLIKFFIFGIVFGIVLTKAEIISWFRIYEMFRFESFHMYGVIGSAVVLGAIFIQISKRSQWKSIEGKPFQFIYYKGPWKKFLFGGAIFGLGWALTGACPGPLFILVGNGYTVLIIAILSALLGTLVYGMVREKLPH
jgi:uncharacterized membrane protein YedE/YeeE